MSVVERPTPAEAVAAIAAVPAGACIATDADGTLWDADLGDDTVRCAAASPLWADLEIEVDAYLAFIAADYRGGCRQAAEYVRGRPPAAVRAALRAFFAPRLRPRRWLVEALAAARARGVDVRIVSAAPRIAAEVGAELIDAPWPVIGIEPDGPSPGVFVEPAPVAEGKPAAWRARGLPPPALALGDSEWDRPLLESAARGLLLVPAARDPLRAAPLTEVGSP